MNRLTMVNVSRRGTCAWLARASVFLALFSGSRSLPAFAAEPAACRVVADLEGDPVLTVDGKIVSWDKLEEALRKVSSRPETVLEYAVTTDEITLKKFRGFQGRILGISKQLGFNYASDVGVHPLGSMPVRPAVVIKQGPE